MAGEEGNKLGRNIQEEEAGTGILKCSKSGAPGWSSWLSIGLLVLSQVMILGLWDRALYRHRTQHSLLVTLPLPLTPPAVCIYLNQSFFKKRANSSSVNDIPFIHVKEYPVTASLSQHRYQGLKDWGKQTEWVSELNYHYYLRDLQRKGLPPDGEWEARWDRSQAQSNTAL